jgi:hypothetical protein
MGYRGLVRPAAGRQLQRLNAETEEIEAKKREHNPDRSPEHDPKDCDDSRGPYELKSQGAKCR